MGIDLSADSLADFLTLDDRARTELSTPPYEGAERRLLVAPGRARVAAFLDPRLRDPAGHPIGQLGHYLASDDEAAGAAIEAGVAWLARRGARRVWGPMNGGAHRPYRLMTSGFQSDPFLGEPRNDPADPGRFEAVGFRPFRGWTSHDIALTDLEAGIQGAFANHRKSTSCRIDTPDTTDPTSTLGRLHRLLDLVWAGHPGYHPFSVEEFAASFGPALSLTPPGHLLIAVDEEDHDLGFGWFYPDPFGGGNRVIWHTIAVRPEARRARASRQILEAGLERSRSAGYERVIVALVIDSYRFFSRLSPPTRRYALYERVV